MDFDIKKLTGDWAKWAQEADEQTNENKNDDKINSAFEEAYVMKAAFKAGKTVEEVEKIFGAEFSKDYASYRTSELNEQAEPADKKSVKIMKKDFMSRLQNETSGFAKSGNWQGVVDNIKQQVLTPNSYNEGYYTKLCNAVDEVAKVFQKQTYDSKDDVKDLKDKVLDKLNLSKNDELKEFKKDIVEEFVKMAEVHQRTKELKKVKEVYDEKRKTMSREDAVKALKKDDSLKGSYYRSAINSFEDTFVMEEARKESWEAVNKQKGSELTTSRKVKKAAKKSMGEDYDKYAKKVFRGRESMTLEEELNFEQSSFKALRKAVATGNRVEQIKEDGVSEKKFRKKLKDDNLIPALTNSGLIERRDDGNFDVTKLSNLIRKKIGADLKASKQKDDLYPYSEVENIVKSVAAQNGINNLSSDDAEKLIKLCGFKLEGGKNWVKIALNTLADTVVVGASALGALASIPKNIVDETITSTETIPVNITMNEKTHFELMIKFTGKDVNASIHKFQLLQSLVSSGFTKDEIDLQEVDGGFKLVIDKLDSNTHSFEIIDEDTVDFYKEFSKNLGEATLKSMLLGLGLNAVKNALTADVEGELPIAVTQFDSRTTFEQYVKEIEFDKKLNDAQKNAFKKLAMSFVDMKDGVPLKDEKGNLKWDSEGYKDFLNEIAGDGSFLSKHEFAIGCQEKVKLIDEELAELIMENARKFPSEENANATNKSQQVNDKQLEEHEYTYGAEPKKVTVQIDNEANYEFGNKHTWKGIAAHYQDCINSGEKTLMEVIRRLKEINGISRKDTVIPADLYLPDKLFDDISTSAKKNLSEADIYKADAKVTRGKVKISQRGSLGKRNDEQTKYLGYRQNGKKLITQELYDTKEEAIKAAQKEYPKDYKNKKNPE